MLGGPFYGIPRTLHYLRLPLNVHPFLLHRRPLLTTATPPAHYIYAPSDRFSGYPTGVSGSIIIATRTRPSSTYLPTTQPYLIAAMNLAPPPVSELYVSHEELIVAANIWAGAHDYALNIKRSSKNKRGIKDKIWLKGDRGGKSTSPVGQKRLHADSRVIEFKLKLIARRPTF